MSFPDEQESFSFSYDPLNEPINILVQLAKDGEIDPWDIDIVSVTDKFLARLDKSDLRTSARALLYASVLLRIKSDIIFPPELPPEEDHLENEIDSISNEDPLFIFEKELDRRLTRKRVRGSPRTLEELVRELRDAELNSNWKLSRQYDTSDSPVVSGGGYSALIIMTAINSDSRMNPLKKMLLELPMSNQSKNQFLNYLFYSNLCMKTENQKSPSRN